MGAKEQNKAKRKPNKIYRIEPNEMYLFGLKDEVTETPILVAQSVVAPGVGLVYKKEHAGTRQKLVKDSRAGRWKK